MTIKTLKYLKSTRYIKGIFCMILVGLISNTNDIITRLVGDNINSIEIAFFRFFFSTLSFLPIIITKGKNFYKTNYIILHIIRALIGFCAVTLWCYGVNKTPLAVVSTIALMIPLFILPIASLILKEKIGWQRIIASFIGFLGVTFIIFKPSNIENLSLNILAIGVIYLLTSAILFATSDIMNKIMIKTENPLTLIFYFSLGTTIISIIPTYQVWIFPNITELIYLFILGSGGNLILYFLIKAFSYSDVSALAPYKYLELIFSIIFGIIIFQEIPQLNTWIGISIIIPSTFAVAYYEIYQRK